MEDIYQLLRSLTSSDLVMRVEGGTIKIADPHGIITKDLLESIGRNKEEVIEFLEKPFLGVPVLRFSERPEYPVSSPQRRLYAIQQADGTGVAYNMPAAFRIDGPMDPERLRCALRSLMQAHSILRTVYRVERGEVRQSILSQFEPALEVQECPGMSESEAVQGFVRPFDLERD